MVHVLADEAKVFYIHHGFKAAKSRNWTLFSNSINKLCSKMRTVNSSINI